MALVHLRARGILTLAALTLACLPAVFVPSASAATETLVFTPEADTYVGSDEPLKTHGSSTGMEVDASPEEQAFLRFRVSGLAGRAVTGARLRMTQADASTRGGQVRSVSSTTWAESQTWLTKPTVGATQLAAFGPVSAGSSYAVDLGAGAIQEGPVSFGLVTTSSDGVRWATRESTTPPRLEVDVESIPDTTVDGLSTVADGASGSSEPTYYSGNHRMALTSGGRLLAVHGRHSTGARLAWRDPAGNWSNATTGASSDGYLVTNAGTGDLPASIAVARDAAGREHAWAVWSGKSSSSDRPVQMRRLTDLDSPTGPRVGPLVTVDAPPLGGYRADLAFETAPGGQMRGALVWARQTGDTTYQMVTAWFTDLESETPEIHSHVVLHDTTSNARFASLVSTDRGVRAVARTGVLRLFAHDASDPLSTWTTGAGGPSIPAGSAPTGVGIPGGEVLAAVEYDLTNHLSSVHRFSASGATVTESLASAPLAQPALAATPDGAVLVGVRQSDGFIVSRTFGAGAGWSTSDRVEIGPEAGGPLSWPNTLRDGAGRLRLIAEGPGSTSTRSSVVALQRPFQP